MPKQELAREIADRLRAKPGQLARDLSEQLGVDKREINAVLHGPLKGRFSQDKRYRWFPVEEKPVRASSEENKYANTALAKLARYYLACMGLDESGVSVFAANRNGELDYCELESLPCDGNPFGGEQAQRLLGKLRRDRSRLAMYLGFPTTLNFIRSRRSSWTGYKVEPLFLFPVEFTDHGRGEPRIDLHFPVVNQAALRTLTQAERDMLMEELVQLEDELGLGGEGEMPDLDDLAQRLQAVRAEWPWIEACDPSALDSDPPLDGADAAGLYNRAVLIVGERSPYTQGLESELKQLAQLSKGAADGTVLGAWLDGRKNTAAPGARDPLIEVLPTNSEQRQAIERGLVNELTIVTGPPGTGKSQVVTNLLVNAAWQGKRVLFASKNNKAVDVVEIRVNALGPRPILLRVGSNQYQTRLAEYLISLLSATAGTEEQQAFDEANAIHERLVSTLKGLHKETLQFVDVRNRVDKLEQEAEEARATLPGETFASARKVDVGKMKSALKLLSAARDQAVRKKQSFITKLFWKSKSRNRFERLESLRRVLDRELALTDTRLPEEEPSDESLPLWQEAVDDFSKRLDQLVKARTYFDVLENLRALRPLESIAHHRDQITMQLSSNAEKLWNAWLRLQPSKLSSDDRQVLNRYNSVLKMVIDSGPETRLSTNVYREYNRLLPKVSHLLPCWAVTSLSARGKLPLTPGYFDLVIFDEASQCDIASALPLLYRAKRAVVIGDPKQLSHISGLPRGHDQQLLDKFDLISTHAHWAYSYNSLFDLAAGMADGEDIVNLRDHHRSHADIIEFSNRFFYEGRLRVATRYDRLNRPSASSSGVRWVNVIGNVTRPRNGGALNIKEAHAIVDAMRRLVLDQGYAGTIGVVAPFRAQANFVRQAVNDDPQLADRLGRHEFLVDTVHKFQGDERDIMIFSPVLSIDTPRGALGFMRNNGNLFNVAITRARAMLIVVGDRQACAASDVEHLSAFAEYSQELEHREESKIARDVDDLGPDYPAVSNPEQVSDWERVLYGHMYRAGIRALPQYAVEKYALDFALFDGERKLNIEVDGERYHRNWDGELCRRDQLRNQRLFELGWDVMRFWVYEIRDQLPNCLERIRKWQMQGDSGTSNH